MKFKEYLIYPLIVGSVITVLAYIIPLLMAGSKEVEYTIEGPFSYTGLEEIDDIKILVNGQPENYINFYRVRIKNTGEKPINNLIIKYVFYEPEPGFKFLKEYHKTIPPEEFGEIKRISKDSVAARVSYSLLNPNDEVYVTFLTSRKAVLKAFSKQEELEFTEAVAESEPFLFESYSILLGMVGLISSVLTSLLKVIVKRTKEDDSEIHNKIDKYDIIQKGE